MIKTERIKDKIKSKKYCLQYLPKSIENLANEKTVFYNGKYIKTAYLIDIMHFLLLKYYFTKDNHFNLSSIILKDKYGYQYNYYMNYLLHINAISLVKNYMKGKNARIYKINPVLLTEQVSRYKNEDIVILRKYKKAVSNIDTADIETSSILPEIKLKIVSDLFNVDIDYEKAMYYLDNTKQDIDCYNRNKYSVETIKDKQVFYHFDIYGRVHTNYTILKSFIRKNCLLINGQETFEIDISNSQPLFLAKIIKEEGIFVDPHEFNIFGRLVLNGEFYQFLMDKSGIKEKKDCKEIIYKTFFGRNNNDTKNPFALVFPTIYKFITDYKAEYGNYKLLAHKLQNEESNFIFNNVIKNLSIINPDISVVTIHDSIIVERKYQDLTENLLNSLLQNEFDFIDKDYIF